MTCRHGTRWAEHVSKTTPNVPRRSGDPAKAKTRLTFRRKAAPPPDFGTEREIQELSSSTSSMQHFDLESACSILSGAKLCRNIHHSTIDGSTKKRFPANQPTETSEKSITNKTTPTFRPSVTYIPPRKHNLDKLAQSGIKLQHEQT